MGLLLKVLGLILIVSIVFPFPSRTLAEVKRVLKPGGKMYYIEHIIAAEVIILIQL